MSQSHDRFWRVFAAITFLNQIVRVPLLLSLATSVKDLEAYFVISATSIPVQFIAQDILQYRSKIHRIMPFERIGLPLFACASIAYVTWHHGWGIGFSYLVFAVAILLYGASVGHLRDVFPAGRVLAMDALYNTGATFMGVTSVLLVHDGSKLGIVVILSQAGIAALVSVLNVFSIRRKHHSVVTATTIMSPPPDNRIKSTPLMLASIMATTQLERLVIAVSQPAVLVSISLAAGITQAWRKIGMDDALVFERLRQRSNADLYHAMRAELIRARFMFYPPLLFAIIASVFVSDIAGWCSANGLFRSLDLDGYTTTAAILCVYLAVMPSAIVMINTLRQRVVPVHGLGWGSLALIASFEIAALVFTDLIAPHMNLAMFMIIVNAGLSHALFMALCPIRLRDSFKLLRLDFTVYILVIAMPAWIQLL
jgi:hypothetical protein